MNVRRLTTPTSASIVVSMTASEPTWKPPAEQAISRNGPTPDRRWTTSSSGFA